MIHILGRVAVEDLQKFIGVFSTLGAGMRKLHGSRECRLYRVSEDDGKVVVLFAWESRAAFEGFLSDPKVMETMKSSGTMGPPEFTFLEELAVLPG